MPEGSGLEGSTSSPTVGRPPAEHRDPAGFAFDPYSPLNVPKPVARDVWIVDGPEIRFRFCGLTVPFPTRMTIVRLPGGTLWLHSPTAPDDPLIDEIGKLGSVRFLVAPNTLHYWFIPDWNTRFPAAAVYAAPGSARRAKRPLPPSIMLHDASPPSWTDIIDQVLVRGDILTEIAFFHRPSRTLILTDLIENFEACRIRRWWVRPLLRLGGTVDPDGKAPIDMRLSFVRRRKTVRAAVERMIAWDPERIIVAHGRWYDGNAVVELRRAFRWVL